MYKNEMSEFQTKGNEREDHNKRNEFISTSSMELWVKELLCACASVWFLFVRGRDSPLKLQK